MAELVMLYQNNSIEATTPTKIRFAISRGNYQNISIEATTPTKICCAIRREHGFPNRLPSKLYSYG
jgi:hypothetical protein